MTLDFAILDALRIRHPAWQLLRSDHALLVTSFLQRVFVTPTVRVMAEVNLADAQARLNQLMDSTEQLK